MPLKKGGPMALKKTLMIAGAVTSIGLATTLGAQAASAESEETSSTGMSSLISKIAVKFNLSETDVQDVFEEHKVEMQAEHRTKVEAKLTQAVADGSLTEDQKAAILAKFDELQTQREADRDEFQNMTREERRTAMEQKRTELEQWAETNDIPEKYLGFVGMGFMHGPGFMEKHVDKDGS
jgi:hypothetical protein